MPATETCGAPGSRKSRSRIPFFIRIQDLVRATLGGTTLAYKRSIMTLPSSAEKLLDRIQSCQARVGVVGLGYVGLPLAVEFARSGFRVTGIDLDTQVGGATEGEYS